MGVYVYCTAFAERHDLNEIVLLFINLCALFYCSIHAQPTRMNSILN